MRVCVCVTGDSSKGAPALHSAGRQRASPDLAHCPAGEAPLTAQHTDTKDAARALSQGEARQTHAFANNAVLTCQMGLKWMDLR